MRTSEMKVYCLQQRGSDSVLDTSAPFFCRGSAHVKV